LLCVDQLRDEPFIAANLARVEARHPNAPRDRQLREMVRDQIGLMVNDVIATTIAACAAAGVKSVVDVRDAGRPLAGFSPDLAAAERELKRFMYARLYHHPSQLAAAEGARHVVAALFDAFAVDPALMGGEWSARLPDAPVDRARHISDYVAGMTDRFAIDAFARIFGRNAVPEALAHV
jgi:dGTPase